ncbi:MAG: DUF2537 domain-containing protein [Sciscionella sp.]
MELRAKGGQAVLVGRDATGRHREVDPRSLALGSELATALHEWARVAAVVCGAGVGASGPASTLVSTRGRQLAARVAAEMGISVAYADPVTGEVAVLERPVTEGPVAQAERPVRSPSAMLARTSAAWRVAARTAEPTPWATGLTVSAFAGIAVLISVVSLAFALSETSPVLAFAANLVITAGLAPSVLLLGQLVVWRWVAYGVLVGLTLGWVVWLLNLL